MKTRRLYLSLLIAVWCFCVCGCRSLHRSVTDGETAVTTHRADTAAAVALSSSIDVRSVSGSATAVVDEERAVDDSTVTETTIAWGLAPDGTVRPTTIRTVSNRHALEHERRSTHEESSVLATDTAASSTAVTTTASSIEDIDSVSHWERPAAQPCASKRTVWRRVKAIAEGIVAYGVLLLIVRYLITKRRLR